MSATHSCTVLILTYKGLHHLELLLPTLQSAIQSFKGNAGIDVLIVDNGRDEKTKQFVNKNFPNFNYQFSPSNDYLFSLNDFISQISSEYTFLLNDDIKLDKEILNHLVPAMDADPSLFAITCRFLDWDTAKTASAVKNVSYKKGWLSQFYMDHDNMDIKYTLYPSGGGSIFRTKVFNELNGFDPLYRPAYYEDTDLGIRAWQNNWKTIYMPGAFLYHREGGTMKDYFEQNRHERMIYRNHILWIVKNVRVKGFLFFFFLMLPYRLLVNLFKSRNHFYALCYALPHLPAAISARGRSKTNGDDATWMRKLNTNYQASAKND